MKSKLFAALSALLLLACSVSAASALTIRPVNFTPDNYSYGGGSVPIKYLSQGADFEYTFTAEGALGEVHWNLVTAGGYGGSENIDAHLTNETGTTTTVYGVFSGNVYTVGLMASDWDAGEDADIASITDSYSFWLEDTSMNYGPVVNGPGGPYGYGENSYVPVPEGNIVAIDAGDLEEGVLETIAADVAELSGPEDISFLKDEDIGGTYDPTQSMKQEASAQNLEYIAQFQTVTVQPEKYYLFEMDFPAQYEGIPVNEIRLQAEETAMLQGFSVKGSQFISLLADRIFAGTELRTMAGKRADTVLGKMLILLFSNNGGSFTMYALRTLAALLTGGAGGCSAGGLAGSGLAGMFAAGITIALRKRFRK